MKRIVRWTSSAAVVVLAAAVPAYAADAAAGKAKYDLFCASCHGATGKGDGPAGAALNPKPRDMSDAAWQKATDDAAIAKVIKDGGAAVGKSPLMVAWGAALPDPEIANIVAHIRQLGAAK